MISVYAQCVKLKGVVSDVTDTESNSWLQTHKTNRNKKGLRWRSIISIWSSEQLLFCKGCGFIIRKKRHRGPRLWSGKTEKRPIEDGMKPRGALKKTMWLQHVGPFVFLTASLVFLYSFLLHNTVSLFLLAFEQKKNPSFLSCCFLYPAIYLFLL